MMNGAVVFRNRLHTRQIICLFICIAGITCFYTPGQAESVSGMALAVASGFSYALYILFLGRSGLQHLHVMVVTFWISLLSATEVGLAALPGGRLTLFIP